MKKYDKRIIQAGVILTISICACILFYFVLFNSEQFFNFGKRCIKLFSPFIYGAFIAYLLNPVMKFFENKISKPVYDKLHRPGKKYNKAIVRAGSLTITLLVFFLFLYLLIIMIVPQVFESIQSIVIKVPEYFSNISIWINNLVADNKDFAQIILPYTANLEEWFMSNVLPKMQEWITNTSSNIIGGVYSTITTMFNFIVGVIVSVFLLAKKEMYLAQAKKIVYATLREERANNLINNARFTHKTFGGFLSGKIADSVIVGCLCFIVLTIFNIPYTLLISVIVGVTNIIPYFGPILGAVPSVILLLMIDPMKALYVLIIILILQQIDGNIIGPKILGDSTGLNSLWVIFAITFFGGIFGVFGMFIGVPLFAVIYAAIRTLVEERLKKKQLPYLTSFYMESDYHSDEQGKNSGKKIQFVKKTFENIYVEGKGKQVKVVIEPDEPTGAGENNKSSDASQPDENK